MLAQGCDQVRQRIIRRLLTNPEFQLADGTQVPAGYIFNPDYGEGFRRLVGEPASEDLQNRVIARVNSAVLIDQSVDASNPPLISFFQTPRGELYVSIIVSLKTQQQGTIVLSVNPG